MYAHQTRRADQRGLNTRAIARCKISDLKLSAWWLLFNSYIQNVVESSKEQAGEEEGMCCEYRCWHDVLYAHEQLPEEIARFDLSDSLRKLICVHRAYDFLVRVLWAFYVTNCFIPTNVKLEVKQRKGMAFEKNRSEAKHRFLAKNFEARQSEAGKNCAYVRNQVCAECCFLVCTSEVDECIFLRVIVSASTYTIVIMSVCHMGFGKMRQRGARTSFFHCG